MGSNRSSDWFLYVQMFNPHTAKRSTILQGQSLQELQSQHPGPNTVSMVSNWAGGSREGFKPRQKLLEMVLTADRANSIFNYRIHPRVPCGVLNFR